ncbi:phage terminase small subunit P27 family [Kaistia algarum]|uniref:phage terminase small subunit P27 family n=1 Tax=Kaistia algarum TaxID=2083279 RepID=UPI000CE81647|nr:phage terminase small subunit P27 family [Kaistia algarum]MCX5513731.1 phage terminase small subunit P27 family [Kaistia algarum]PPE79397.1 phage terminase small subunit P27 family [Kaistia algarum]
MRGVKPYLAVDNGDLKQIPDPPEWIGESAADEWRRAVPDLVARGRLNGADLGSVEAYCVAMGQVRDLQAILIEKGPVIYPQNGGLPKRHPAAVMQAEAMSTALRLAAELGLTPVSRGRPSLRDNHRDDGNQSLFGVDF